MCVQVYAYTKCPIGNAGIHVFHQAVGLFPPSYNLDLSHHSGIDSQTLPPLSLSSFWDWFPLPPYHLYLSHHSWIDWISLPPIFLIILGLLSLPYHLCLSHHSGIDSLSLPPLSFSSFYDWFHLPTTSIFLIILGLIESTSYHLYLCHHSGIDSLSLPPLSFSSFWDWFPLPTISIFLIILGIIPPPYHLYLSHPYLSYHSRIDFPSLPHLSFSSF